MTSKVGLWREVYAYASDPHHLSEWAAGLAHRPVERIDGQWVVDSPLGRVVVEFAPENDYGIVDHMVTVPDGTKVLNPMRTIPNSDGCDVVFSVRRQPGMKDADDAKDADAVRTDLDTLKSILEH